MRTWLIIGRFRIKFALVHFRRSFLEVGLDDMRSENRLLDAIDCDGAIRLHLPSAKSMIHYIAGSQALIFLS